MNKRILATIAGTIMATALIFGAAACGGTPEEPLKTDLKPTIYLAGDSTVKTYEENWYIGGWGQYLGDYLDGVKVVNAAQGGRSSRSFINEGRLYDIEDASFSYNFTQNEGKSIGSVIKKGDFLFIQFGHNDDDTKKTSSYSTMYNRMVPLGTPDASGKYPVTAPTGKKPTTYLPEEYTSHVSAADKNGALTEIAKYGSEYYSYDCGGTYKWYLKQYVDFAREKEAIPVLVTPVARVNFNSDGTLKSGPGLHGQDFAYVKAVRQLAQEEDCLLVDLFAETKTMLETATREYANYLMALVPNEMDNGPWPSGYDTAYGNPASGFTKVEATHYNKYGAYLTAAKVAESIKAASANSETHNRKKEYYTFSDHVKSTPTKYVDPSNLISKTKVAALEGLFGTVNPTNPNRTYPEPATVIAKITEVCTGEVTAENYLEYKTKCEEALAAYNNLNVDDRSSVTNYSLLQQYITAVEAQIEAHRPKPVKVVAFDPSSLDAAVLTSELSHDCNVVYGAGSDQTGETGETAAFKIVAAAGKTVEVKASGTTFTYNGKQTETTKCLSMGGSATFGTSRYVEFTTTGACRVTVVARSTGADDRTLNLVKQGVSGNVTTFKAGASQSVTSQDLTDAGTYQIGSAGSGIYIYCIIVEYYA